jgi:hypothetical protein
MIVRHLSKAMSFVYVLEKNNIIIKRCEESLNSISYKLRGETHVAMKRYNIIEFGDKDLTPDEIKNPNFPDILSKHYDKLKAYCVIAEPQPLLTQSLPPKRIFMIQAGCGHVLDMHRRNEQLFMVDTESGKISQNPNAKYQIKVIDESNLSDVSNHGVLNVIKLIGRRWFELIVGAIGGAGGMAILVMALKFI